MNKDEFLEKYNLAEKFEKSGFDWGVLESIYIDYTNRFDDFETVCSNIATQLRKALGVHSVKYRAKNPEHLIEKIIRKSALENEPEVLVWRGLTQETYTDIVTDVMGLRALHLYKADWGAYMNSFNQLGK